MPQLIISPSVWYLIPFPGLISLVYFRLLPILLLYFEVHRHQSGKRLYIISDLLWICLCFGFSYNCSEHGIFFCVWVGNSWFGTGLFSWLHGYLKNVGFIPTFLALSPICLLSVWQWWVSLFSPFDLGVVNINSVHNSTLQLDTAWHRLASVAGKKNLSNF